MKVRINIDKVSALDAGSDRHGLVVVEVPASEFTPEERAILARNTYGGRPDEPRADFYLDDPNVLGGYHAKRKGFYAGALKVATEATPEAVHAVLKAIEGADARAMADIEAEEEKAAKAEEARAKEQEDVIRRFAAAPIEELIRDTGSTWDVVMELTTWVGQDPRVAPRKEEAVAEARRRNERRRAEEKAEAERVKIEKGRWVVDHGSDYLKKAYGAGYDCQRLYVTERAAMEHPGFVVDFDDLAAWKERSCPSEAALDAAEEVEDSCEVVWLTAPPWTVDEYDEEGFEPREALVIGDYLGKYDLVRMLDGPGDAC